MNYIGLAYLHSNMYLLIPVANIPLLATNLNLHSNMYLLIPYNRLGTTIRNFEFTFQHVSINSYYYFYLVLINYDYLHSNMYLLILSSRIRSKHTD